MPKGSDWLSPYLEPLRERGNRVLELGCGPGWDAATLLAHGFEVIGFDRALLTRARVSAPRAHLLRADLGSPLPFRDGSFDAAAASLSMHYLPWAKTRAAFAEVARVLRPGAPFLFRVNATDDYHHGAGQGDEIEPNFYHAPNSYHADTKRFFDEPMVREAMEGLLTVRHLEHVTIHRYELPKRAWECLAYKTAA